jgi:hypothetical protein
MNNSVSFVEDHLEQLDDDVDVIMPSIAPSVNMKL